MEEIRKLCPMTEEDKVACVFTDKSEYREPWGIFDKTRRKTAEISFKAGQQDVCTVPVSKFIEQGRKEVVGWIEKEFGYFIDEGLAKIIVDDGGYYGEEGSIKKYQAQKKKWRVNNERQGIK